MGDTVEKFDYLEPKSLDEAISLLAQYGEEAKVMAGGQSLLVMMGQRLLTPRYLISLAEIPGLDQIEERDGVVSIGAMTTHREVAASPIVNRRLKLLAGAVGNIGSPAVRNLGTLGGDLCMNEVGADPPQALLALEARAKILGPRGERTIPLDDFFTGYLETCLGADELLTHILIPLPPETMSQIYLKHCLRVLDRALVGVALALDRDDGGSVCRDIRIGLGGVAPTPFRARKAEEILKGAPLNDDLVEKAGQAASEEARPLSDVHGSSDYRRKMVQVFVKRAIQQAMENAES
ncbi:MAG: FAD binding domain-containing protein [Dehalococcoidia bacterium]